MQKSHVSALSPRTSLAKCRTGIKGLDEVTGGGLPEGRPTLVCGSAGCGKTLLAIEFLVRGATECDEPGVFLAFEETREELTENVASLGFHLDTLIAEGKMWIDHVRIDRSEMEETGEYDLEGLFIRLGYAIDRIGAKRVVLDTIETLFFGLSDPTILRAELRRLFRWLKDKGVTAIITGERGQNTLTREGLEEYVSDCVILLDHRVMGQVSTRRLRIVKYRGSLHGTNEYPFLITEDGMVVVPITSAGLNHSVSTERVSTGIVRLDEMLDGQGYYRGSSILVSGTPGTGKSSVAAHFVDAACRRGEKCVYFAFDESPDQIIRNMRAIGIDLDRWRQAGSLSILAARPAHMGLENHLAVMHKHLRDMCPDVVVADPINNFITVGNAEEVQAILTLLIDSLKMAGATALFTALKPRNADQEDTNVNISSMMDTWLLLRDIETGGERNRGMYVLKSRGMAHSNQIREFVMTDHGIVLLDIYTGPGAVLTGTARTAQEARERKEELARQQGADRNGVRAAVRHRALEAQIAVLQADLEAERIEERGRAREESQHETHAEADRAVMAHYRGQSEPRLPMRNGETASRGERE